MILIWILLALGALTLLAAYLCYRMAFYSPPRKPAREDVIEIPEGEIYEVFRPAMEAWGRETRAMAHEDLEITSFDGLTLRGKYYEFAPGAPIELMFHGYRGSSERDLSGGVQRCFALGRSALIVDQRCSGTSEGSVITFGVREHRDCLSWVDFMVKRFGPEVKIILTGISMGASTVVMAAGRELPDNVIGVLADCGFCSAREIILEVIRQMGLPPKLGYPFVKLGAKLFARFDLEEYSPMEALKTATKPIIFFHGGADDFVPCWMSEKMYEACPTRKRLVVIPGAGHGLAFPVDQEGYLKAAGEFFDPLVLTET